MGSIFLSDLADAGDARVIGVEVPGRHPQIGELSANLDPQHDGGVYGFGGAEEGVPEGVCAAMAAAHIIRAGWRPRGGEVYWAPRWDADACCAAAVLAGRIPPDVIDRGAVPGRLALLDAHDAPRRRPGTWKAARVFGQGENAVSAGDAVADGLAGLNAIILAGRSPIPAPEGVKPVSLDRAVALAADWLVGAHSHELYRAAEAVRTARERNAEAVREVLHLDRGIAVVDGARFPAGSYAYDVSPVAVLRTPLGGGRYKVTIMCHPGAPEGAYEAIRDAEAAIREMGVRAGEAGWGGPPGMLCSPFQGGSRLPLRDIVDAVADAMEARGVSLPRTSPHCEAYVPVYYAAVEHLCAQDGWGLQPLPYRAAARRGAIDCPEGAAVEAIQVPRVEMLQALGLDPETLEPIVRAALDAAYGAGRVEGGDWGPENAVEQAADAERLLREVLGLPPRGGQGVRLSFNAGEVLTDPNEGRTCTCGSGVYWADCPQGTPECG